MSCRESRRTDSHSKTQRENRQRLPIRIGSRSPDSLRRPTAAGSQSRLSFSLEPFAPLLPTTTTTTNCDYQLLLAPPPPELPPPNPPNPPPPPPNPPPPPPPPPR